QLHCGLQEQVLRLHSRFSRGADRTHGTLKIPDVVHDHAGLCAHIDKAEGHGLKPGGQTVPQLLQHTLMDPKSSRAFWSRYSAPAPASCISRASALPRSTPASPISLRASALS